MRCYLLPSKLLEATASTLDQQAMDGPGRQQMPDSNNLAEGGGDRLWPTAAPYNMRQPLSIVLVLGRTEHSPTIDRFAFNIGVHQARGDVSSAHGAQTFARRSGPWGGRERSKK